MKRDLTALTALFDADATADERERAELFYAATAPDSRAWETSSNC